MHSRNELLTRLRIQRFDLLVIGGGIVGAGIARDAVMRGLTTALIEQGDFASGTSSKTSKLIHGGLRYLEQGHLGLVVDSIRERATLRTIAPALVHPLTLLLPVYAQNARPLWKVRVGLSLYDLLACGRGMRPHRILSPRQALELEHALSPEGLRGAGLYADCQMDDARLCLANVLQAIAFGAVCCNYVRMRALLNAGGRVCGARGEDLLSGSSVEIQARVVVNATGPWADHVRRVNDRDATPRLAPTKGIHLVLPSLTHEALFVEARADRRMIFLLPWGDYTLVGTTERAVDAPLEALNASDEEIGYLLDEVHRIIPGRRIDADDIVATFAGARPLLAFSGSSTQASREHRIDVDRSGLVSVMGGKYTTYRRMAQDTMDYLVRAHPWRADGCLTNEVSLLEGVHPVALDQWRALIRTVDPDLLARLLTRYGTQTLELLTLLDHDPALGHPVCPHHEYIDAEFVHAFRHELACTVTDVLARRTRLAWSSCQGLDSLSRLTELFEQYGGMSHEEMARQAQEYRRFLAHGLAFRRAPSPTVRSHVSTR